MGEAVSIHLSGYGETEMADTAICKAVGEELMQLDGVWTVVPDAPSTFPDSWRVMEDGKPVLAADGSYVTVVPTGWQVAPAAAFTPPAG